MKESYANLSTTPFEDLILGSQFMPVLTYSDSNKDQNKLLSANIGIFKCKKCEATLLQEQEALNHYKLHVFESHKDHFSIVVGGLCPNKDCCYRRNSSIHFHCDYCQFSSCEILELPFHMEKGHLNFYKEVSLVLREEDIQLNKVFKCGECNTSIQGTVSIIHHLLTHDSDPSMDTASLSPQMNGFEASCKEHSREIKACSNSGDVKWEGDEDHSPYISPLILKCLKENHEKIQIEINPLDLLSSLIEEDLKSENPVLPTKHFLLGHSNGSPHSIGDESSYDGFASTNLEDDMPNSLLLPPFISGGLNGFSSESYYEQSPGVFQCSQCNEAFKYQYLLVAHRKQVHQGNVLTPFKCHICGNEFALLIDHKRHMTTHSLEFTHFCQVCGHAFADNLALKSHLVEHGKSPGKISVQQRDLQPQSCSPVQERSAKCECCNLEFPSKSELTRHIVKFQGTCNPNKSETLRCATCGDEIATLDALKEHRKNVHPLPEDDPSRVGKKGFQCDYCGKTFSCRSNLRDHLVVHTGEKPYPCDICGKAFSFIHNMKTHRLTHNLGRNEMCPYCDKAYKSKISLYYHMKKGNCRGLSTKEVPEGFRRCTECLQMFASEERYQSHKTKGACHMSYRCLHCGIRCSSEEKLEKHLQKGLCNKESRRESATTVADAEKHQQKEFRRRRRRREQRKKEEEPVCCERCNNYNRDCCCTFSCPKCGKRVFSSAAFMTHQKMHSASASTLAAAKQKKERKMAAIIEKRRRKRLRARTKKIEKGGDHAAELKNMPAPLDNPELVREKVKNGSIGQIKETVLAKVVPTYNNTKPLNISQFPNQIHTNQKTAADEVIEENSNSGSLADLSTFTSSNLLKQVQNGETTAIEVLQPV